jgi:hypothetical protein
MPPSRLPILQNNRTICWWGDKIYLLTFLIVSIIEKYKYTLKCSDTARWIYECRPVDYFIFMLTMDIISEASKIYIYKQTVISLQKSVDILLHVIAGKSIFKVQTTIHIGLL